MARSGITNFHTSSTPLDSNVCLILLDGAPLKDATLYQQLVDSLIYLTVSRPDIIYTVYIVSQFMNAPQLIPFYSCPLHSMICQGALGHRLQFSSQSSLVLSKYSNVDWAGDSIDQHSTRGYCFYMGDSLISLRSKKQTIVSRSSTETEYHALVDATFELGWLHWLLANMGVPLQSATYSILTIVVLSKLLTMMSFMNIPNILKMTVTSLIIISRVTLSSFDPSLLLSTK